MKIYILFVQTDFDSAPHVYGVYKTWEKCYQKEKELKEFRNRLFDKNFYFETWTTSTELED